jgi:hypothetical protein
MMMKAVKFPKKSKELLFMEPIISGVSLNPFTKEELRTLCKYWLLLEVSKPLYSL